MKNSGKFLRAIKSLLSSRAGTPLFLFLVVSLFVICSSVPSFAAGEARYSTLNWHTFAGDEAEEFGKGVAVDGSGNVYLVGSSYQGSWGEPLKGPAGSFDAFLMKTDSSGAILWTTFMGSAHNDYGEALAVDSSGNVTVAGYSRSPWGDPVNGHSGGAADAFVARFDTDGARVWNTFLGSTEADAAMSVALDASGNVYVGGFGLETWGSPVNAYSGERDAFAAKLNSSGVLQWNSFAGSADADDFGRGIAVDSEGNVVMTGESRGTWGDPVQAYGGENDAFAVKFNSSGTLQWNTFLGSSTGADRGRGIVVDSTDDVIVVGASAATWGTPVRAYSGNNDGFAAKLDGDGALQWNTFLGSDDHDTATAVAIDESDSIYVVGESAADWGTPEDAYAGGGDLFLAALQSTGTYRWHTFQGSDNNDGGYGLAVDLSGNAYVAGDSLETWGTPVNAFYDLTEALLVKVAFAGIAPAASSQNLTIDEDEAAAITLVAIGGNGSALTYTVGTGPTAGTLSGTPPEVTYTPGADWHGTDSFTFRASDGEADSNEATVSITVTSVNDPPTGWVRIDGTALESETLTLADSLDDAEGMGAVSYQWKRNGANIDGFTGLSYTLTSEDLAAAITVTASYTDGAGTAESVTSATRRVALGPGNDLVFDFTSFGLWLRAGDGGSWTKVHSQCPELFLAADINGSGADDLVADFGAYGIWVRYDDGSAGWTKIHHTSPELMTAADINGTGAADLVVDFGSFGIWVIYDNDPSSWTKIHNTSPEFITAADIDGSGADDLVIDFGSFGVWVMYNNDPSSWTKIHNTSPELIAAADIDGSGADDLVVDFGSFGVWVMSNNDPSSWTKIHNTSPELIVAADIDGSGADDLVMDFGSFGIWVMSNNDPSSWTKLHNASPELIAAADIDGSGADDLVIDFGSYGVWALYDGDTSTWAQVHLTSPEEMAPGNLDR